MNKLVSRKLICIILLTVLLGTLPACSFNNKQLVSSKLKKFEQEHKGKVVKMKDLDAIMNNGGKITFDNTNIYGSAYMVIYGLIHGDKKILNQCVYNHKDNLDNLTNEVKEFAGDKYVAPYFNRFEMKLETSGDKMFFRLDKCGMDFGIQFSKIEGKYYFQEFTKN